jgi:O-antigen/teichoic acid export membrane protein
MNVTKATAAHGTVALVSSQAGYLFIGYFVVVLLAREFGPVLYGTYGVIMSVLVWMEQSGTHAVPSATAKLLAETTTEPAELERSGLTLNMALYGFFFVALWLAAPWLADWFGIANGTFLFRVASLDLPFFGAYTAYRAIHQGKNHFFRLGATQIIYAATKLAGILLIVQFGISLEAALFVNAAATVIGLLCLLPGTAPPWQGACLEKIRPLLAVGIPIGFYHFLLSLRGWLLLWMLQIMSPDSEKAAVGVFIAALNIAKLPSLALSQITTVILPSLSRALALNNANLAGRYIHQALRFGVILNLPICLVLAAQPEALMQLIYSRDFSGGGSVLCWLVVGEALRVIHAILGTILAAAGEARKTAVVTLLSFVPYIAMLLVLISAWGSIGAAVSGAVIVALCVVVFGIMIWKQFGSLMNSRSAGNIGLAGCLMFLVFALVSQLDVLIILPYAAGLITYAASLIVFHEITRDDLATFLPWMRLKPNPVSQG